MSRAVPRAKRREHRRRHLFCYRIVAAITISAKKETDAYRKRHGVIDKRGGEYVDL